MPKNKTYGREQVRGPTVAGRTQCGKQSQARTRWCGCPEENKQNFRPKNECLYKFYLVDEDFSHVVLLVGRLSLSLLHRFFVLVASVPILGSIVGMSSISQLQ